MIASRTSRSASFALVLVALACRPSAAPGAADSALSEQVLVELALDGEAGGRESQVREARERFEVALRSAGIEHEVVRRYETIPWVALRIAPASRERVARLPDVVSVRDDRVERAQPRGTP